MCTSYDFRCELIAKILFLNKEKRNGMGSGFLISEDTLVTAYHNVEAYIECGNEINIIFNKYVNGMMNILETSIERIICKDSTLDFAVLKLQEKNECKEYFKFVNFPIAPFGMYPRVGHGKIKISTFGYINGRDEQKAFDGVINNIEHNSKNAILHLEGINDDLFGLSGSPLIISGTRVYGINLEQNDPQLGLHIESVTVTNFRKLLVDSNINISEYDDYFLIEREEYKDILLDEVISIIEEKDFSNEDTKKSIVSGAKYIIKDLKNQSVSIFEQIINSINLSFDEKYKLNDKFIKYAEQIAEVICHLVMLKYTYQQAGFELTGIDAKSIRIKEEKYISYIYLFKRSTYLTSIINVFKYFNDNAENDMSGISSILIGSSTHKLNSCDSLCKYPYNGSRVEFERIIDSICSVEDDPFEEKKGKLDITKIKQNFESIKFHCQYCLQCDEYEEMEEITGHLYNVLGE
jgi:Trypsin-like serine proteases, typically periplasmic, contain C-terminal PDZ domain